jgi:hypothetical protein
MRCLLYTDDQAHYLIQPLFLIFLYVDTQSIKICQMRIPKQGEILSQFTIFGYSEVRFREELEGKEDRLRFSNCLHSHKLNLLSQIFRAMGILQIALDVIVSGEIIFSVFSPVPDNPTGDLT